MARTAIDITNTRFSRLTALEPLRSGKNGIIWRCRCDCGNEIEVKTSLLRNGNTKSCGCARKDSLRKLMTTHGATHNRTKTPTYESWRAMRARCELPKNSNWKYYGGRGIRVCDEWRDFAAFLADMGERPPGHTIERKDVNGNYEPGNCVWLPKENQSKNRRKFGSCFT